MQSSPTLPEQLTDQVSTAVQALVEKLEGWGTGFVVMLPNALLALLVVFLAVFLARLVRRGVVGGLGHVGNNAQVANLLASLAYLAIVLTGVFVALGLLRLDKTVAALLAGVGVVGLALGFAFQDIASNFISGVLLAFKSPFRIGDPIESSGISGIVEDASLRYTIIRTFDGRRVYLPNNKLLGNPIINFNAYGRRRIEIVIGVSYDDDLERAHQVALETVEGLDLRDPNERPRVFYERFGDSAIDLKIWFWVVLASQDFLDAQSQAIIALKRAFDAAGLDIPFPIRTLTWPPDAVLPPQGDGQPTEQRAA